jgi:hypothetical protein
MFIWATPAWWKHSREVSAVESEEQAFPLGLMPVLNDLLDPLLKIEAQGAELLLSSSKFYIKK